MDLRVSRNYIMVTTKYTVMTAMGIFAINPLPILVD